MALPSRQEKGKRPSQNIDERVLPTQTRNRNRAFSCKRSELTHDSSSAISLATTKVRNASPELDGSIQEPLSPASPASPASSLTMQNNAIASCVLDRCIPDLLEPTSPTRTQTWPAPLVELDEIAQHRIEPISPTKAREQTYSELVGDASELVSPSSPTNRVNASEMSSLSPYVDTQGLPSLLQSQNSKVIRIEEKLMPKRKPQRKVSLKQNDIIVHRQAQRREVKDQVRRATSAFRRRHQQPKSKENELNPEDDFV